MKRLTLLASVILISITQTHIAEAGYSLKVTVKAEQEIYMDEYEAADLPLVGTPEAQTQKNKYAAFVKSGKAKNKAITACKDHYYFNARLKVLDARGGTAGLGNVKTVTVANLKSVSLVQDIPAYYEDERNALMEQYGSDQSNWPDYIQNGYISYSVAYTCSIVGTVSVISSNAYRIYINSDPLGEFSKSELVKKKWSIAVEG
jgi:hypothetical protein